MRWAWVFGLREGWAFHSKNWEIRSKQHKRIPPGSILMYPSSLGLYTVSNTFCHLLQGVVPVQWYVRNLRFDFKVICAILWFARVGQCIWVDVCFPICWWDEILGPQGGFHCHHCRFRVPLSNSPPCHSMFVQVCFPKVTLKKKYFLIAHYVSLWLGSNHMVS